MTEQKLTHWKKLENPDYIGAYSLESGKDLTVTIETVKRELITGTGGKKEECSVAYLQGQKPFILNRTNQKTIAKVTGTPYIEQWAGKQITLYVAHIKAFGEDNVECLRVRPTLPVVKLPEITPENKELWEKTLQALKGGYTFEQIRAKYFISPMSEQQLKQELKNEPTNI